MNQIATTTKSGVLPLTEINKFEDFISAPAVLERIKIVLPAHLNAERMMRTVALAAYKNPKLREVHMMSLLGATMTLASLGLEPNTPLGHAYLIPFDKNRYDRKTNQYVLERVDVNVILGYKGLIDLARRTGSLVSITAKIVYQGDEWSYEYGSNQHLRHRPVGLTEGRKPKDAYAFAKLTDGEAFEVLPYGEALSFRRYSQAYQTAQRQIDDAGKNEKDAWKAKSAGETPWIKHEREMVQKTMVRRLSNWLPMSINYAAAHRVDHLAEQGKIDYAALATTPIEDAKDMLTTGVVPEQEGEAGAAGSDDTPENRPERDDDKGKKTRKRAVVSNETAEPAKASSAADTPIAQAARQKAETVDPSTGEIQSTSDGPPEMSAALEDALGKLLRIYDPAEIDGARPYLKKELTADDFAVWQRASLEAQQRLSKQKR